MLELNKLYNMDCMEGMKEFPDNYFDLAIVDPPYGAGFTEGGGCQGWFSKYHQNSDSGGGYWNRFGQRFDKYKENALSIQECQKTGRDMGVCELEGNRDRNLKL